MKKEDKKNIVIFIILLLAIAGIVIFNYNKNKKLENIDRKIEYILGYTYDSILNRGEVVFLDAIDLLINEKAFDYEILNNGKQKKYSIDSKNYFQISNFNLARNIFTIDGLVSYMQFKNIIENDNRFYIEDKEYNYNKDYIGSSLDIIDYYDDIIIFESNNYYCENNDYIGLIHELPSCKYNITKSKIKFKIENNTLKIMDIDGINKIVQ